MKSYSSIFLGLLLMLSLSATVFAQGIKSAPVSKYDSVAANAASGLQQKILLSDKQTSQIKDILTKYIETNADLTSPAKLFSQIVPLLDSRQKIKFQIIRNDWWDSIVNSLKK